MKQLIIVICISICSFGYAQDKKSKKWYSNAEFDLIIHKEILYTYTYLDLDNIRKSVWEEKLNTQKAGNGFTYSYNYMLFRKFSLGAIAGYRNNSSPDLSMLELGGILKFFFVDTDNIFLYGLIADDISLNKNQFRTGTNAKIGIGVPIMKRDEFNISINLFRQHQFIRGGVNPIFNYPGEKPIDFIFKSYGISAGIKF